MRCSVRIGAAGGVFGAAFAGAPAPCGGLGLSEGGACGYRQGARFLLGPALDPGLEGERRESRTARIEHSLVLCGRVRRQGTAARPVDAWIPACAGGNDRLIGGSEGDTFFRRPAP